MERIFKKRKHSHVEASFSQALLQAMTNQKSSNPINSPYLTQTLYKRPQ